MQHFGSTLLLVLSATLPTCWLSIGCKGGEPKPTQPVAAATVTAKATASATTSKTAAASSAEYVPPVAKTAPLGAVGVQGSKDKPQSFGAPIAHTDLTPLSAVIGNAKKYAEQSVQVEGLVRRACSRKGCWMEVAADETGPACRVTFQDYGFFVPTDSAGAQARLQAVVKRETLSPNQVRHHEREGASFPNKNPDGSADEVRLVASGVELWH